MTTLLILSVTAAAQSASNPSPESILRSAALFSAFDSMELSVNLDITERRGSKERDLAVYVEKLNGDYRALIQVTSPAFLNKMKFLTLGAGESREQWMSTSRGVRRLAASNRNERLFDSDFTVEDLSNYDPADYQLALQGSRTIDGVDCHVLEARPISGESDYARKVLFVSKSSGLLHRAEFYNEAGTMIRLFTLLEQMSLSGSPFPKVGKMETFADGTYTILTVNDAQAGLDIPDRLFNRGNL